MYRLALVIFLVFAGSSTAAELAKPPNIIWIVVDDMSAHFSCYGDRTVRTPHVDRLASEGTRFTRAFVTAPVCSPSRSALITGCYQTTIGAQHHRSGRGERKIHLPGDVVPVPLLFRQAGYYTCIGGFGATGGKLGKTDYNFEWPRQMYDGNDWSKRKPGQPFFMQVQLHGGKYRGQGPSKSWQDRVRQQLGSNTRPEDVTLPPYYPRDPVLLQDWADYLDCCRFTDWEVGEVIARLEKEKLLDDTVIFFMTDHGISHARGKQFLYDEGIHIPFVVRGPGIGRGVVRDDLIEHIDMNATSLALAGIEVPKWMQARNILAKDYVKRDAVFAARDRCDETMEHLRSVRTERYKYIRNYLSERPHLQPNRYKDDKAIVKKLRELHAGGKLDSLQEKLLFAEKRPAEELFDLAADPHELNNLAADPGHRATLEAMRHKLKDWEDRTGDQGRKPERAEMYDSDMKVYLDSAGKKVKNEELLRNIELNKKWAREGK
jgi:arylsulfatase A-like enzyme